MCSLLRALELYGPHRLLKGGLEDLHNLFQVYQVIWFQDRFVLHCVCIWKHEIGIKILIISTQVIKFWKGMLSRLSSACRNYSTLDLLCKTIN